MSSNRIIAIIIVALIHVLVGYALVTGLAYSAVKQAIERVTTVDIEEPPPPEEEPPPPEEPQPDTAPPPIVAPPPPVRLSPAPPPIPTQPTIPPPAPPALRVPPPAPVAPPAPPPAPPPPPKVAAKPLTPRNSAGSWVTTNDYRTAWINQELVGTATFTLQVNASGSVDSCSITGGTAPQPLKDATCSLIQRRAKFNPAVNTDGTKSGGTYRGSIRWELPE